MAEVTTIARPYAEAVFKLAVARDTLAKWSTLLAEMGGVAAHPDMRSAITNPKLPVAALSELFAATIKSPMDQDSKNFVQLLIENDRLDLLPEIASQFEQLKSDHEGVADAEVVSAFPLSDAELNHLTAMLEKRFKRKIKPTVSIDKELIAGVKVTVGNEVLDASVRARLQAMATALQS
jgi:F-type H+-transporting ATPase subunit delta